MNEIKFYSVRGNYGEFSSFYGGASFVLKGKKWSTREHYFQAQKFPGTRYESEIRQAKGPMEAATQGRDKSKPLRKDWESVKFSIMKEAILAQCLQNKDFAKLLIDTGEAVLIEHTEKDAIWGDGGNGKGKNLLGKALMEIRDLLNNLENK